MPDEELNMPDLYGNPVVSGQMIPHGNQALTQNTQVITEQFWSEAKYVKKKVAFGSLYSTLPVVTESVIMGQTSMPNTNQPAVASRGFTCLGDSIV
jgi:hypothetical protein